MLINSHPSKFAMESSASHLDTTWATMMSKFLWSSDHHLRYKRLTRHSKKVPHMYQEDLHREIWSIDQEISLVTLQISPSNSGLKKNDPKLGNISMSTWRIIPRDDHVPTQWDYSMGDATEVTNHKNLRIHGMIKQPVCWKTPKKATIPRVYRWFSHENLHL